MMTSASLHASHESARTSISRAETERPTIVEPLSKRSERLLEESRREHLTLAVTGRFQLTLCSALSFIKAVGSPPA